MRTITPAAALIAIAVSACGEDGGEIETATQLPEARLQRLAEQYPRLDRAPLPAPEPSGASDIDGRPALQQEFGEATFYAQTFEGKRTASGIPFRQNQFVAAHRAFPFGTVLRVTNTENGRAVNVRVVDRGPHGASAKARQTVIDLSRRAAEALGYLNAGRAKVQLDVLEWGPGLRS